MVKNLPVKGEVGTVREGFLEAVIVYFETRQFRRALTAGVVSALITAMSPAWFLGHCRHPRCTH